MQQLPSGVVVKNTFIEFVEEETLANVIKRTPSAPAFVTPPTSDCEACSNCGSPTSCEGCAEMKAEMSRLKAKVNELEQLRASEKVEGSQKLDHAGESTVARKRPERSPIRNAVVSKRSFLALVSLSEHAIRDKFAKLGMREYCPLQSSAWPLLLQSLPTVLTGFPFIVSCEERDQLNTWKNADGGRRWKAWYQFFIRVEGLDTEALKLFKAAVTKAINAVIAAWLMNQGLDCSYRPFGNPKVQCNYKGRSSTKFQ